MDHLLVQDIDYEFGYGSPDQMERIAFLEDRIAKHELLLAV